MGRFLDHRPDKIPWKKRYLVRGRWQTSVEAMKGPLLRIPILQGQA